MINVFQQNYDTRLRSWYDLRTKIEKLDIETKCVEIDRFWQNAPLVNHHLHILDTESWPDPWQLLSDNVYCPVARALGILYTISLLDRADMADAKLVLTKDGDNLVLVAKEKYILNWSPDSVVNTFQEVKIVRQLKQQQIK